MPERASKLLRRFVRAAARRWRWPRYAGCSAACPCRSQSSPRQGPAAWRWWRRTATSAAPAQQQHRRRSARASRSRCGNCCLRRGCWHGPDWRGSAARHAQPHTLDADAAVGHAHARPAGVACLVVSCSTLWLRITLAAAGNVCWGSTAGGWPHQQTITLNCLLACFRQVCAHLLGLGLWKRGPQLHKRTAAHAFAAWRGPVGDAFRRRRDARGCPRYGAGDAHSAGAPGVGVTGRLASLHAARTGCTSHRKLCTGWGHLLHAWLPQSLQEFASLSKGGLVSADMARPAIAVCHSFPDCWALPAANPLPGGVAAVDGAPAAARGATAAHHEPMTAPGCPCPAVGSDEVVYRVGRTM